LKNFNNKNAFLGIFKSTLVQIALILWSLATLIPLGWTVMTSFKSTPEIIMSPFSLPKSLQFSNYVFSETAKGPTDNFPVGIWYMNSIIIVIISLTLLILITLLAGYAIAKLDVPGKNIILFVMVGMVAIPLHSLVIPLYYFFVKLHLLGNYFSVVFPLVTINIPFAIILLQAYFKEFPDELIESAKIDGAGNLKAFFSIVLPCSLNSIAAVLVINFLTLWNDFFIALIMLKKNTARTLPLGMTTFFGKNITDYGSIFAVVVLAIIPTIIIFVVFSRFLIKGFTAGAIKG